MQTSSDHTHEQLEGEPDKHYAVFFEYLCMGEGRRINALSGHYYSRHHIYHLSQKYHWRQRILSYEQTVGNQIRMEKKLEQKSYLSEYQENALLTFGVLQGRYREFIGNISNFWPNQVEETELKEFIQKKNKEKREAGDFKNIMPLYSDPGSDKNNVSKQLSNIERVLSIIGKFQIVCDKFIKQLEVSEFEFQTQDNDAIVDELDKLAQWAEDTNRDAIGNTFIQIEQESTELAGRSVDFERIKN